MDVRTDFTGLKTEYQNVALGLGNFDGVHLGHQELVRRLVAECKERNYIAGIMTFDPHPLAVVRPSECPPFLMTHEAKLAMLDRLGIDLVVAVPFSPEFAQLSPYAFVDEVLCSDIAVRAVYVGYNYSFGHRGRGTPETLVEYAHLCDYDVRVIEPVTIDNAVVSSTLIRLLMLEGRIEEAGRFLGYDPFLDGKVIRGDRRGTVIGFPTANLAVRDNLVVPASGVYVVKVETLGECFHGVANIGVRPTFKDRGANRCIEVHILDFNKELYGEVIRVHFMRRIRDERKFDSVNELLRQIRLDVKIARACFSRP